MKPSLLYTTCCHVLGLNAQLQRCEPSLHTNTETDTHSLLNTLHGGTSCNRAWIINSYLQNELHPNEINMYPYISRALRDHGQFLQTFLQSHKCTKTELKLVHTRTEPRSCVILGECVTFWPIVSAVSSAINQR